MVQERRRGVLSDFTHLHISLGVFWRDKRAFFCEKGREGSKGKNRDSIRREMTKKGGGKRDLIGKGKGGNLETRT